MGGARDLLFLFSAPAPEGLRRKSIRKVGASAPNCRPSRLRSMECGGSTPPSVPAVQYRSTARQTSPCPFADYIAPSNTNARRFEQLTKDTIRFIEELERVGCAPVSCLGLPDFFFLPPLFLSFCARPFAISATLLPRFQRPRTLSYECETTAYPVRCAEYYAIKY